MPLDSISNSEDEASEAEMPPHDEDIGALRESSISFRQSGRNERLGRDGQPNDETTSSGDSVVFSPYKKPRRQLMRKEKGKKKLSDYDGQERVRSMRIRV